MLTASLNAQHRGQYSDAVLNELESQNDAQIEGIMGKVRVLKDVCPPPPPNSRPKTSTHRAENRAARWDAQGARVHHNNKVHVANGRG
jgi:hypothetical protein